MFPRERKGVRSRKASSAGAEIALYLSPTLRSKDPTVSSVSGALIKKCVLSRDYIKHRSYRQTDRHFGAPCEENTVKDFTMHPHGFMLECIHKANYWKSNCFQILADPSSVCQRKSLHWSGTGPPRRGRGSWGHLEKLRPQGGPWRGEGETQSAFTSPLVKPLCSESHAFSGLMADFEIMFKFLSATESFVSAAGLQQA